MHAMSLCAGYDSLAALGHSSTRAQRGYDEAPMTEAKRRASLRAVERMKAWREARRESGRGRCLLCFDLVLGGHGFRWGFAGKE